MEIICIVNNDTAFGDKIEDTLEKFGYTKMIVYSNRMFKDTSRYKCLTEKDMDELKRKEMIASEYFEGDKRFQVLKPFGAEKYVLSTNKDTAQELVDIYKKQVKVVCIDSRKKLTTGEGKTVKVKSTQDIKEAVFKILNKTEGKIDEAL